MKSILRNSLQRLISGVGIARKQDIDNLYRLIAGHFQIESALSNRPVIGNLRGWALSPDAMALILADLQVRRNTTMIEFGMGQSTVVFSSMFRNSQNGRLICIEHDPEYASTVYDQLEACGLVDFVDVKIVPLAIQPAFGDYPVSKSYDVESLGDISVDVALVDGPPRLLGAMTRFTPLDWSLRNLSLGGVAYLDDAQRESESIVIAAIREVHNHVHVEMLEAERGLARLRRVSESS